MRHATATQPAVTWELVIDLLDVLDRHRYRKSPCDRDVGRAIGMVTPLVQAYTGTGDDG
jgi:hypothetical protein